MKIPYLPVRFDYDIPVYESPQLERFGLPDNWGIWRYRVIETRESMWPIEAGWSTHRSGRPTHRYHRMERITSTVHHLTGTAGKVPDDIIELVEDNLWDTDPETMWLSVQTILKNEGKSKYFNRIGSILQKIGFKPMIEEIEGGLNLDNVFEHFSRMSIKFDQGGFNRTYFPPMRYVALRYE